MNYPSKLKFLFTNEIKPKKPKALNTLGFYIIDFQYFKNEQYFCKKSKVANTFIAVSLKR